MSRRGFIGRTLAALGVFACGMGLRRWPTRLSVDESDPGYMAYCDEVLAGWRHRVFCDGREVPNCVTADEVQGYAWGWTPGPNGLPFIENPSVWGWRSPREGPSRLARTEYRGRIAIERRRA